MYFVFPRLNPWICGYLRTRMGTRSVEKSLPNEESIWGRVKADHSVDKRVSEGWRENTLSMVGIR